MTSSIGVKSHPLPQGTVAAVELTHRSTTKPCEHKLEQKRLSVQLTEKISERFFACSQSLATRGNVYTNNKNALQRFNEEG